MGRKLYLPKAGVPRSIAPRLPDSCGKPQSIPGARGTQRLQPRVASATSTTAATVAPTSTRRCTEATTPGVGDATTAGRIGVRRPNHPVCKLSAGPYDGRHSRPGSEPRLPSPSTRGRQGRNYGSRTIGWPTSWVERTMTTSLSVISPCSSPTPPEPGWSICLLRRSLTGTTWSKPSPETSRAHTCALGTPRISEATASSQENPCGTTSDNFQSSAPSCPTSPTQMSSARSSPAPLATTW
jgi:ribosomal protein S30